MTPRRRINVCLLAALALNAALWAGSRQMYARWAGVPPAPAQEAAAALTLGDTEFAFRSGALGLQHLGDGGGRTVSLRDYDYDKVGAWLWLLHGLDPASEHVPAVAAYYFGAVRDKPEASAVLVDYLTAVGQNPAGEKWRWLAEAVFLARHRMNDLDRALDAAYLLSRMKPLGRDLPAWAREMPAFVLEARGEKAAAREMVESMLREEANLSPEDLIFMKLFMTGRLGVSEAEAEALFSGLKK